MSCDWPNLCGRVLCLYQTYILIFAYIKVHLKMQHLKRWKTTTSPVLQTKRTPHPVQSRAEGAKWWVPNFTSIPTDPSYKRWAHVFFLCAFQLLPSSHQSAGAPVVPDNTGRIIKRKHKTVQKVWICRWRLTISSSRVSSFSFFWSSKYFSCLL